MGSSVAQGLGFLLSQRRIYCFPRVIQQAPRFTWAYTMDGCFRDIHHGSCEPRSTLMIVVLYSIEDGHSFFW